MKPAGRREKREERRKQRRGEKKQEAGKEGQKGRGIAKWAGKSRFKSSATLC